MDSTASITSDPFIQRMIRASRLDSNLYEEVEADRNATREALKAVVVVAIASGIGGALKGVIENTGTVGTIFGLLFGVVWALVGWVIWSYLTYFIGTKLFNGTATPGELLRTIGFAQSPGVLNILTFIPVLGPLIGFVVWIWVLVAGVIAVRQALDFDTGKAIITTVIGWLVIFIPFMILVTLLGVAAAVLFGAAGGGS